MMLGRFSCCLCLLFAIALLISLPAFSQKKVAKPAAPKVVPYAAVDKLALQIPDSATHSTQSIARYINASFSTESDKARAAFVWVAKNISYDVDNKYLTMFAGNPLESIHETLVKRTGVCSDYAELFSALANQTGLKTHVVSGYTKSHDGAVASLGHAWCVIQIDEQWYLMDPTWAAGFVVEDTFVPRLNNEYYKVLPTDFIRNHMPFDPMWQLLSAPYTAQQFQRGTEPSLSLRPFSFTDSISAYEQQDQIERLRAVNRRVKQNGVNNDLIFKFLSSTTQHAHSEASSAYHDGITKLTAFLEYFNHQFLPRKTDAELQLLLPSIATDFARARAFLAAVHSQDRSQQAYNKQFDESLREVEAKLHDCESFMERYLRTGKFMRPMLFRNISGPNEIVH